MMALIGHTIPLLVFFTHTHTGTYTQTHFTRTGYSISGFPSPPTLLCSALLTLIVAVFRTIALTSLLLFCLAFYL